jgi:hypothetical protein
VVGQWLAAGEVGQRPAAGEVGAPEEVEEEVVAVPTRDPAHSWCLAVTRTKLVAPPLQRAMVESRDGGSQPGAWWLETVLIG